MSPLTGKTAIVTGASAGIGRGIAERLGADGASVLVNYRSDATGAQAVVDDIVAAGGRAEACAGDISLPDDVESVFATCLKTFGTPDILVNNAGLGALQPLAELDEATYDRVYGLNCRGTLFCLKQTSLHLATVAES